MSKLINSCFDEGIITIIDLVSEELDLNNRSKAQAVLILAAFDELGIRGISNYYEEVKNELFKHGDYEE